jgi:serine/threonine protein kinase
VFAETDMDLWGLTRRQYDRLDKQHPELRAFLTTVLTRWFDSRKVIAERQIGKYTLTEVVGQGAYAIVYKGMHRDLDMPVAIKMMRHDMAMEADFIEGFHREARTIAGFRHENIVKIFDIEEKYRTVFIIMEYLEGKPLRQILNSDGRLPAYQVVKYVQQICSGLQYAHRQQIVHQDIKPGNIFVLPGDEVKIVDFGLSVPCGTEAMMTGTPFYMSPEQIECLPVDTRADIFALGIMAYEMVTGNRPFAETDGWKVMDLHVEQDIPDPAEAAADIPEPLRNMIRKACAREPDKRYQEIGEVLMELSPLLEDFDLSGEPALPEGNHRTTLSILHQGEHSEQLQQLIEEFKAKVEQAGMALKTSDR